MDLAFIPLLRVLFRSELPYSVRTALHFNMRLHFRPLLNAAAELGPIMLFSEGFVAFDGRTISANAFGMSPSAGERLLT
jgi:hypothetical protein